MRTIKFRAWGKNIKEFLSPDGYPYGLTLKEIQNIEDIDLWEFQQFTGLKDKNGKEIYEGDVVITKDLYRCKIVWDLDFARWQIIYPGAMMENIPFDCEVIENIFDNPELINHSLT